MLLDNAMRVVIGREDCIGKIAADLESDLLVALILSCSELLEGVIPEMCNKICEIMHPLMWSDAVEYARDYLVEKNDDDNPPLNLIWSIYYNVTLIDIVGNVIAGVDQGFQESLCRAIRPPPTISCSRESVVY